MPTAPEVQLASLPRANGSAAFSHNGFKVLCSVSGPIESPKRDEAVFEAMIEVIVRPAAGVGGTRERHLESLISSALYGIIPVKKYPRCLIQIVLQITETPKNAYENAKITQAHANLSAIPALLHSAIIGLMSAAIPLNHLASAVLLAISTESLSSVSTIIIDPTAVQVSRARSIHIVGFTSTDELLLMESEGSFTPAELKAVLERAKKVCCQEVHDEVELETAMEVEGAPMNMKQFMRSVIISKVKEDLYWKVTA